MVSFAYNLGVNALGTSTLLKKHLAGDYKGAQAEFLRWNKANGRVLTGLTKRRQQESALYGR
jgi:GH24 family phage-related lysozyme (muramidase)